MEQNGLEPTCTFQNVASIGGGYLAATWLFSNLILSQADGQVAYIWGNFGLLIQLGCIVVLIAQRKERLLLLQMPKQTKIWGKANGDVVLIMLNCLLVVAASWIFIFGLITCLARLHHGKLHPLVHACF